MTQSVDRLFELHDRCIAAGLPEIAKAIVDTIMNGAPLETNLAGVRGRWRIEAKQVLRRRRAPGNPMATVPTGERSAAARKLHDALSKYAASAQYKRGAVPTPENAALHLILTETNGRVPSVQTLRKKRAA
jgi:hypothetical protein